MRDYLFDLKKGDFISAVRPVYNGSNEMFVDDKKIRPFVVLEVYEEMLLVVAVTSNAYRGYNFEVAPWSYAKVNDLYLISKNDIHNIYMQKALSEKKLEALMGQIYKCILKNDILYDDEIKKLFIGVMVKRVREQNYQALLKENRSFSVGDIIYAHDMPDKKYIIDKVMEDGYLAYRVNCDGDINFESIIKLIEDEVYWLDSKMEISLYQAKKECYIEGKYRRNNPETKKTSFFDFNIETGDIVVHADKKYLAICSVRKNKNILAIPFMGNYIFDNFVRLPIKDCRKVEIGLSDKELLVILKKILMNINISGNENILNSISMKIKKL